MKMILPYLRPHKLDEVRAALVAVAAAGSGSGRIGDGKVFVLDVAQAHRIRTRETGDLAL